MNNKYKLTNDHGFKNLPQQDRERDTGLQKSILGFFQVTFLFIIFFFTFVILYLCSTNMIINKIVVAAARF